MHKRILTIEYDNEDGSHSEVHEFLEHLYNISAEKGTYRKEYEEKVLTKKNTKSKEIKSRTSAFISYSGANKTLALLIANILSEHKIDVWMDDFNIKIGDTIVTRIESGIREAEYFIVLITNESIKSSWVLKEIELAYIAERENESPKIIPLVMEDVKREDIPNFLWDILWLNINKANLKDQLAQLIEQIRN